MRVLLATDNKELDEYLKKHAEVNVVGEVYYREALVDSLIQNKADLVLLSAYLGGKEDILDIVFQLRMADARVIMLMGTTKKIDQQVLDLISMGVYDILFSPISVSQIIEVIKTPMKLSTILNSLNAPWRPESKGLLERFKAFLRKKKEAESSADDEGAEDLTAVSAEENMYSVSSGTDHVEEVELEETFIPPDETFSEQNNMPPQRRKSEVLSGLGFFNLTNKAPKERAPKKEKVSISSPPAKAKEDDFRARAVSVIGTAQGVGSTSFAIALSKKLEQMGCQVRISDLGGGARKWLRNDSLECVEETSIIPQTITVFDIGSKTPGDALPFSEYVFIVTDNGPDANPTLIMPYIPGKTFLVGTKGMGEDIIMALSRMKMVEPLLALPETSDLLVAEREGVGVIPKDWERHIETAVALITET